MYRKISMSICFILKYILLFMEKTDNPPIEEETIAGLKRKLVQEHTNFELTGKGGRANQKDKYEDDRGPRCDVRKTDLTGLTRGNTGVGHKRRHDDRGESSFDSCVNTQLGPGDTKFSETIHVEYRDGSGMLTQTGMGPKEKKWRTGEEGKGGPLIKSGNFPKSPLSPHLKLKELAHRKGSLSPCSGNGHNQNSKLGMLGRFPWLKRQALPCPHHNHENPFMELSRAGKNRDKP